MENRAIYGGFNEDKKFLSWPPDDPLENDKKIIFNFAYFNRKKGNQEILGQMTETTEVTK